MNKHSFSIFTHVECSAPEVHRFFLHVTFRTNICVTCCCMLVSSDNLMQDSAAIAWQWKADFIYIFLKEGFLKQSVWLQLPATRACVWNSLSGCREILLILWHSSYYLGACTTHEMDMLIEILDPVLLYGANDYLGKHDLHGPANEISGT